jgi:hypothetical protein
LGVNLFQGESLRLSFPNGTFSMVSMDLNKLFTGDGITITPGFWYFNASSINLVGTLASGDTVTAAVTPSGTAFQTFFFPPTWQNLSSVTITARPLLSIASLFFAIDNIVFTPSPCTYSFSVFGQPVSGRLIGPAATTLTTGVVTTAGCPWSVSGLPAWITSTSSGVGDGLASLSVATNNGGPRTGTITVGNATYTIEQSGLISGTSLIGGMPHIAAQDVWTTTFTLVNKSTSAAQQQFFMFNDEGLGLPLYLSFPQATPLAAPRYGPGLQRTIAGNASLVMDTAGPQAPLVQTGSALLSANGAIDGFAIFRLIPGSQEAVVPLETRNASSYILAFDNTGGVVLGVAVQNVANTTAIIPVVIRDDAGAIISAPNSTLSLAANGHTSFVLSQQYPFTANKRGTVEFTTPAGGRIGALGIRTTPVNNTLTLTTVPALANVGTTGGSIAHIATGSGWQTTFVLVNTGATAAQATLKFFADQTGAPLAIPLSFPQSGGPPSTVANTVTQTIAPGAQLVVQSAAPASDPAPTIGSAQLTTDGNVGGFVVFRYNTNGQEAVVPLESRTSAAGYIIAFDNTAGTATGIAINNGTATAASVPVILRDDTGTQIGSDTLSLAGNGHISFTLGADRYPIAAGKRGTIEFLVSPGSQIGALGIRIPPALTFTTLPALAK